MFIVTDENNFIIRCSDKNDLNGCIEIPDNVYKSLGTDDLSNYRWINGQFKFDDSKTKILGSLDQMTAELEEIERWYAETDYMPLKVVRGNWEETDQRYVDYLAEYEVKHQRAEEIKILLNIGGIN